MEVLRVSTIPSRSFDVRVNESDGKLLLVRGFDAFELDDVAATIWSACDGQRTVEQVIDAVVEAYDIDRPTAQRDVEGFLAQLRDASLLE
jgi:hypothetical protein